MRDIRTAILFFVALVLMALAQPAPARPEPLKDEIRETEPGPIVIRSKSLEVDNRSKVVTFSGNVRADRGDFAIDCQKMLVFYSDAPSGGNIPGEGTRIEKIVASGEVKISRAQGGMAASDQVVYYHADEKMVLTGRPVVKRGNDFVEGDRITIYLKEDRSIVESTQDSKVRATIFPGRKGD
jgi:lipopolysaccharide export system protein LptA